MGRLSIIPTSAWRLAMPCGWWRLETCTPTFFSSRLCFFTSRRLFSLSCSMWPIRLCLRKCTAGGLCHRTRRPRAGVSGGLAPLAPPPPAPGFLTEHSGSAVPVLGLHLSLALCWGPLTPCLIFLSSFGVGLPANGTITAPATLDRKARQITGGICAIPSSTSSDLP